MPSGGRCTLDQLAALVAADEVDTVLCAFPDLYGRLMGKRLDAEFFLSDPSGTHVCDYLFTVDMEMEVVDGYDFANWAGGYGDVHLAPDLDTLRVLSWQDRTAMVLCDAQGRDHQPVRVSPRAILRAQIEALGDHGYRVLGASELEYFLFRDTYRAAADRRYRDLSPAGWYVEDYHLLQGTWTEDVNGAYRRHLRASGIPVESTKGEAAVGQHEVNIAYAPVLEMADRHVLTKQCGKEVAAAAGAALTFMAKPVADAPGSSCHLHVSLWRDEHNAFAGEHQVAGIACSDEFRWFLGGWMAHTPELMVCLAPTVNSYKRYQQQSWAPTGIAWSPDNRTAGFRIVGEGPSLRIECRLPGADVNPYLAYAAVLAAGRAGIEQRIEPPPVLAGDAYTALGVPPVPTTLGAATTAFAASDLARRAFGDDVVDHYTHFFATEDAAWRRAVTDWERVRYFERI